MFSDILPIITLIIGLFLTELSYIVRSKREDKKEIGLILSFLLEISYRLKVLKYILDEVKKIIPFSSEDELKMRNFLENFFPLSEVFTRKFNDSIDTISKFNPILGFRLRAKDQFIPYMQKFRDLALTEASSIIMVSEMDNLISKKYIKVIDEMLQELVKAHSFKTKFNFKKNAPNEHDLSEDFKEILQIINKYKN